MKNETFWMKAAADIKRFRKGQLTANELKERYPELDIQEDYLKWEAFKESVCIHIPSECPLHCAVKIVFCTEGEPGDINRADRWLMMHIPYQPEWEQLLQVGRLHDICRQKRDIDFYCCIEGKRLLLRYCVEEGDHGDEDGFGMEPDTWLIRELNPKGNWIGPFYIQK